VKSGKFHEGADAANSRNARARCAFNERLVERGEGKTIRPGGEVQGIGDFQAVCGERQRGCDSRGILGLNSYRSPEERFLLSRSTRLQITTVGMPALKFQ